MYIVFNELSILPEISTIVSNEVARERINDFVELLHLLKTKDLIQGIICTSDIYNFQITGTYGMSDWLSDKSIKNSYKQFFRTLCNKSCTYIQALDYINEFKININNMEYSGTGCLIAVETNNHIISIINNDYWKQQDIWGEYVVLNDDSKIICTEKRISNISKIEDKSKVEKDFIVDIYASISSGQDLWEQRSVLFPNLVFCDSVKAQLYKDSEKFHVLQIIFKLQRIQQYFKTYNGIYNPKELGLNARTESETVKNSKELRDMRLFRKPNGDEEYFFDHIGFSGKYSGGRIYFLPDDQLRKCYIGYIGKHLPTKKF